MPIGKLLDAVRRLIRPLLRRVLNRARGRLPAPLQPAARRLARRLGLQTETTSSESDHPAEHIAAEFDARLAEQLLSAGDPWSQTYGEDHETAPLNAGVAEQHGDPIAALDVGRRRLADYFQTAEHQADPTAAMEQFLPAVLPLVKLGISVVGRDRVVKLVAGLIARLIQPMVGGQLAPELSKHIASSGLSLIGLEAAASGETSVLGPEALVSAAEDTIREVLAASPEVLQSEMATAALTHEAFTDAVARHLPTEVLRPEVAASEDEHARGLWVMMPRGGARRYRYRAYSRPIHIVIHRPVARQIILSGGETLEDRLLEAGVSSFPAEAEVEAFETLPGGEPGHVIGGEVNENGSTGAELTTELEELSAGSSLNMLLPRSVTGPGSRRHHYPARRYLRMRVHGVRLRRRSVLSMRLVVDGGQPTLTAALRLGEHQAHVMAQHLARRSHVNAVREFQRWVRGPFTTVLTRRLAKALTRHQLSAPEAAVTAAGHRLADVLATGFAEHIGSLATQLAEAAKDPQHGVTIKFTLHYASREAILTSAPTRTALTVSPGWHHA